MQLAHTDKLIGAYVQPAMELFGDSSLSASAASLQTSSLSVKHCSKLHAIVGDLSLAGNLKGLYSNPSKICRGQAYIVEPTSVRRTV